MKLSNCKSVADFNDCMEKAVCSFSKTGAKTVKIDGKKYTMNEVVYKLHALIQKDDKAKAVDGRLIVNKLDQLEKQAAVLFAKNFLSEKAEKTSFGRLTSRIGNLFFSITHGGFKKEKVMAELTKRFGFDGEVPPAPPADGETTPPALPPRSEKASRKLGEKIRPVVEAFEKKAPVAVESE